MALIATSVTAGHPGAESPVVLGVNLTVPAGRILGLSGPSGCGKTTLARVLVGLAVPRSGAVTVDGTAVGTRRGRMDGRVGMLFQSPRRAASPRMALSALIGEPLRLRGDARTQAVAELATAVGLTRDLLGRTPREVSDGQLQRACLARALAANPAYLVCDEATVMLDAATTATIAAVLSARAADGMGVLAISHDRALLDAWAHESHDLRDLAAAPR